MLAPATNVAWFPFVIAMAMTSCGLSGDCLPRRVINPCTPDYDKKNAERAFRGGNQASCSEECKALLVKNGRCVSVNVLFPLAARSHSSRKLNNNNYRLSAGV